MLRCCTSIFLSFFFLIICFIFVIMLRCVNCIFKRIYGYGWMFARYFQLTTTSLVTTQQNIPIRDSNRFVDSFWANRFETIRFAK